MTRKHYEAIAAILASVLDREQDEFNPHAHGVNFTTYWYVQDVAHRLADYFEQDNPKFQRARFLAACGIESHICQHNKARAACATCKYIESQGTDHA